METGDTRVCLYVPRIPSLLVCPRPGSDGSRDSKQGNDTGNDGRGGDELPEWGTGDGEGITRHL